MLVPEIQGSGIAPHLARQNERGAAVLHFRAGHLDPVTFGKGDFKIPEVGISGTVVSYEPLRNTGMKMDPVLYEESTMPVAKTGSTVIRSNRMEGVLSDDTSVMTPVSPRGFLLQERQPIGARNGAHPTVHLFFVL